MGSLEEPYVANWACEVDMPHAFTSNSREGNFYTTLVTDNVFVSNALVFATVTLPVFGGSKNAFIKKSVFFRFECAIVNGLWFGNFAVRP